MFQTIGMINTKILKKLIDDSARERSDMKKLYERYEGATTGVPVLTRRYTIDGIEQRGKINNKLANDFFGEIIDMKVGFFCGVPITYTIEKDKYDEAQYAAILDKVQAFNNRNEIADLDAETARRETICGMSGRLFYYDAEKNIRAQLVEPWEIIFTGDSVIDPEYSIRVYETKSYTADGEEKSEYRADVYDASTVTMYSRTKDEEEYTLVEQAPHQIPGNPLIGFMNNDEAQGDAEKVLTLIDAYDSALSDVNSEMAQFRLAYLAVYGAQITADVMEAALKAGAFSLPTDAKMEWLSKALDDAILEHHLDRLERNIYRFSRTPNLNDTSFSGDITGVALKYKFRSFEDKCKTSELKFKKSLRQQYKILAQIWALDGVQTDYLDYRFIFTRNYPQNLIEEIDFLTKAQAVIPDKLAYSLVSFVENPDKIENEMKEKQQESLDAAIERMRSETMTSENDEEETTEDADNTDDVQR